MKDVTFRFWRPDEKMPECSCRVLTLNKSDLIMDNYYSSKYGKFNVMDDTDPETVERCSWPADKIEAWAYVDPIHEI